MSTNYRVLRSFKFAFEGIKEALKTEPNLKIHFSLAFLALILAWFLKLSLIEWTILVLTIGLVLILELINTSVEAMVDLVSPQVQPRAKVAKDVAAAAVLISALVAIFIAAFLFLPKIV